MRLLLSRMLFLLISTTVMVFFSEKVYWHPTGYGLAGLVLFYAVPVFLTLWGLEFFRVRKLPALILCAALFGFLVEGVLTTVIYEAGLFDPVMPAYFIGWHGLLSVVFGWYFIRTWLVRGQWKRMLSAALAFGVFWGLWATTFWLPENVAEFEGLAALGEPVVPGIWTPAEFGFHALVFTLALIAAHWVLGLGMWRSAFRPSKPESGFFILVAIVFLALPLAIFKLGVLVGLVLAGLWVNRNKEGQGSVFCDLAGRVRISQALILLAMPLAATAIYSIATLLQLSEGGIRAMFEGIPLLQSTAGGLLFLWALVVSIWPQKKWTPSAASPS